MIDEIVLRHRGKLESRAIAHDENFAGSVNTLIANQYGHFAPANGCHQPVLHLGNFVVIAAQDCLTGDIPGRSIAITSNDEKLLLPSGQIDLHLFREDGDVGGAGRRFLE